MENKKNTFFTALAFAGMLCVLVGIAIPAFIGPDRIRFTDSFRYVYAVGALLALAGRMFTRHAEGSVRLRRLHRIETWSAIAFCMAAFLMFYDRANLTNPVAFTLAGAVIQLYTAVMIPREKQKK